MKRTFYLGGVAATLVLCFGLIGSELRAELRAEESLDSIISDEE